MVANLKDLEQRFRTVENRLSGFRIVGGSGVLTSGSLNHGYVIDVESRIGGSSTEEGGPPSNTGCTDPLAINFDPSADFDDGSCLYDIEGCTDPSASNFDPSATIDDGSCIYPGCTDPAADNFDPFATEDDGSCIYGSCPTITMTCDSISASGSKCGYTNPGDGKLYLGRTFDRSFTIDSNIGGGHFCPQDPDTPPHTIDTRVDFFGSGGTDNLTIDTFDPVTCTPTSGGCSDTGGLATITRAVTGPHPTDCDTEYPPCVTHSFSPGCGPWTYFTVGVGWAGGDPCGYLIPFIFSDTTSYSTEYTTALLISVVDGKLPAYSGVYTGGACASSRFLSSDEMTYSIQRSKPKFSFTSTTIDFILSYVEHFVPAGGGGGGFDNLRTIFVSAGDTEAFGPELLEPASNGTTSIIDIMCMPT